MAIVLQIFLPWMMNVGWSGLNSSTIEYENFYVTSVLGLIKYIILFWKSSLLHF